MIAKEFCVCLTSSCRKDDIIQRMMGMALIGALQIESEVRYDDVKAIF